MLLRTGLVAVAVLMLTARAPRTDAQQQASLLITAQELQRSLGDPALVILHVGPRDDYDRAHIAGARYVELRDVAVRDSANNLNLELPQEQELITRLERLGISDNSKIVVAFGQDWGSPATRVMWTLQAAGLGDRARFLDGGVPAWSKAGFPLTSAVTSASATGHITRKPDYSLRVDHKWIQAHVNSPRVRIVDARAPMFYDGPGMKSEGMNHPAGHIAGAVNIPFNTLVDDAVQMLSVKELRAKFDAAGIQPGDTVAAYCHIGQQGTMVLFAARLLGHPTRLYDGSMNDWDNRKLPTVNEKTAAGGGDKR